MVAGLLRLLRRRCNPGWEAIALASSPNPRFTDASRFVHRSTAGVGMVLRRATMAAMPPMSGIHDAR